ncbi:MAG: CsbD family protein [Chloroflexi bacterium]|nr:CsbD family protein [Chloroflexota bacterium]
MNDDVLEGKWKQIKGSVQEKWGELTNDDLDQIQGNRKQLVGKVQERYGKTREEAQKEVDNFLDNLGDTAF